jgi:hypothetical protein
MKLLSENYVQCEGMEYVVVGQNKDKSWTLVKKRVNLGPTKGGSFVT